MVATYSIGMPLLAAGMTLVPSPIPMSIAPCPTSGIRFSSILFWNSTSRPASRVVALLLGEVELRELDARDVAEPDDQLRRREALVRRSTATARRRSTVRTDAGALDADGAGVAAAAEQAATERGDHDRGGDERDGGWSAMTDTRGPPMRWAGLSGRRRAGARRRRRSGRGRCPTRAIVRSVANISGMSNSDPRARLMRTARPLLAPAHSPTIAPTTASVTPTRSPPKMFGRAAGISSVVRIWREVARRLRPSSRAADRPSGCRPSSRWRPGRRRSARRSRPC